MQNNKMSNIAELESDQPEVAVLEEVKESNEYIPDRNYVLDSMRVIAESIQDIDENSEWIVYKGNKLSLYIKQLYNATGALARTEMTTTVALLKNAEQKEVVNFVTIVYLIAMEIAAHLPVASVLISVCPLLALEDMAEEVVVRSQNEITSIIKAFNENLKYEKDTDRIKKLYSYFKTITYRVIIDLKRGNEDKIYRSMFSIQDMRERIKVILESESASEFIKKMLIKLNNKKNGKKRTLAFLIIVASVIKDADDVLSFMDFLSMQVQEKVESITGKAALVYNALLVEVCNYYELNGLADKYRAKPCEFTGKQRWCDVKVMMEWLFKVDLLINQEWSTDNQYQNVIISLEQVKESYKESKEPVFMFIETMLSELYRMKDSKKKIYAFLIAYTSVFITEESVFSFMDKLESYSKDMDVAAVYNFLLSCITEDCKLGPAGFQKYYALSSDFDNKSWYDYKSVINWVKEVGNIIRNVYHVTIRNADGKLVRY